MSKKILRLEEIIKQERKEWANLVDLGDKNNLVEFWKAYAEYLHSRSISPSRKFLVEMATKTWQALQNI